MNTLSFTLAICMGICASDNRYTIKSQYFNYYMACKREIVTICQDTWQPGPCPRPTQVEQFTVVAETNPSDEGFWDVEGYGWNCGACQWGFKSKKYGTYLSAQPDGSLHCDRQVRDSWEQFRPVRHSGRVYYLRSIAFQKYISAQPHNHWEVNRDSAMPWEQIELYLVSEEFPVYDHEIYEYGIYAICLLLFINVICCGYYIWNRVQNRVEREYKVVSIESETEFEQ
eukprot:398275_1